MTLEQRVEALERKASLLEEEIFVIKNGKVFINDAKIQSGEIKAAHEKTAYMQISENEITVKIDQVNSVRLLAF